jgi:hypothetical protein
MSHEQMLHLEHHCRFEMRPGILDQEAKCLARGPGALVCTRDAERPVRRIGDKGAMAAPYLTGESSRMYWRCRCFFFDTPN